MPNQSLTLEPVPAAIDGCCAPLMAAPLVAEQAADLAKAFKALGDPVRLRLLSLITSAGDEVCVCDLTGAFDLTGPTISHHLKEPHHRSASGRHRGIDYPVERRT
jgi:ArsR family transcriptional regulator, arsenate/arsenite/antimonite-responsive transcriptional repressor